MVSSVLRQATPAVAASVNADLMDLIRATLGTTCRWKLPAAIGTCGDVMKAAERRATSAKTDSGDGARQGFWTLGGPSRSRRCCGGRAVVLERDVLQRRVGLTAGVAHGPGWDRLVVLGYSQGYAIQPRRARSASEHRDVGLWAL